MAIFAALYASLVYLFAPVSFYELQFRVADILPPAIAKKWKLAIAYAVGCVAANIISPFVGVWELVFMPFMSFVAGILGFLAAKLYSKADYYICGIVHAVVIALAVSYMLEQLFFIPLLVLLPMIFISELVTGILGATIFKLIERRYVWWE
jgi:uncharacterized membrane protein